MPPAPSLNCGECGRTIAKARTHCLTSTNQLLCSRCLGTRGMHDKIYPDCPSHWHDMHDHPVRFATRAAAAHILGLWP